MRFATVIPCWLYSVLDSDNSGWWALFGVGYKEQTEQTPDIILHCYVSNLSLKIYEWDELTGAYGERAGRRWGRSPPAPTREVTPFINVQQSRLILLKSTRDNTNSVYIYTNSLSIDCALCKCKADTVLILLPCYVKRKIIFNKMLSVYVNIWNSSDLLNLYTVSLLPKNNTRNPSGTFLRTARVTVCNLKKYVTWQSR